MLNVYLQWLLETITHVLLYCSFYAVHLGQQNFLIKWLTAPLTKFKVILMRFIYNSLFSDSAGLFFFSVCQILLSNV